MDNQTRNHLSLQKHIADQDHIIRVRNAEIAALRKRAEKAEQERDEYRAMHSKQIKTIARLQENTRPLTADDITDEMVERAYAWGEGNSIAPRAGMRALLAAALAEPSRPEGAEEIEAVIRKVVPSHPEDHYGDLADRLAERGVRVTGGN